MNVEKIKEIREGVYHVCVELQSIRRIIGELTAAMQPKTKKAVEAASLHDLDWLKANSDVL